MRRALASTLLTWLFSRGAIAQSAADAGVDAGGGNARAPTSADVPPSPSSASAPAVLHTGFVPDPVDAVGRTRGVRAGLRFGPDCAGFFPEAPSHRFELSSRFGFLRVYATGPGDLALVLRHSEGTTHCSDDRFETHPAVEGMFLPGQIEVWVGTKREGAESAYTLRLTETRSMRPGGSPDSAEDSSESLGRDLGLNVDGQEPVLMKTSVPRGFLPDPRWLEGDTHGSIDAVGLGGMCRGFTSAAPTHIVTLEEDFDYLQMYLRSDPAIEGSLLVMMPSGRFLCAVSVEDWAQISADHWPRGDYRIWVATRHPDAVIGHRVGISEIRRVR